jgi:hypothetical protein
MNHDPPATAAVVMGDVGFNALTAGGAETPRRRPVSVKLALAGTSSRKLRRTALRVSPPGKIL